MVSAKQTTSKNRLLSDRPNGSLRWTRPGDDDLAATAFGTIRGSICKQSKGYFEGATCAMVAVYNDTG